jgi:hypothetical protein
VREDSKGSPNRIHFHDGTTCHGFASMQDCLTNAVKCGYLGRVLERTDTVSGGAEVKCYSLIVGSFAHWARHGKFVAETYVATRQIPGISDDQKEVP